MQTIQAKYIFAAEWKSDPDLAAYPAVDQKSAPLIVRIYCESGAPSEQAQKPAAIGWQRACDAMRRHHTTRSLLSVATLWPPGKPTLLPRGWHCTISRCRYGASASEPGSCQSQTLLLLLPSFEMSTTAYA